HALVVGKRTIVLGLPLVGCPAVECAPDQELFLGGRILEDARARRDRTIVAVDRATILLIAGARRPDCQTCQQETEDEPHLTAPSVATRRSLPKRTARRKA